MEIFSSVNFWSLYILPFTFGLAIHLEFIFVWNEVAVRFHFSCVELKLIHCHLVKRLHFPHFLYTAPLITVEENVWIWVCFWMLFSVLFIHFYLWLYCSLNHCSSVVNFYVWDCKSLNLVLIQEYFSLCSALYFYMNFRIRLSISIHLYTYRYAYEYC